ncbi:MAG: FMN-binding protein [Ruminococcaceae bacterium]|jgi:electron transport complex protein RnfG|nr:FMN-binding protein [Oscillospiraceae bacterium]
MKIEGKFILKVAGTLTAICLVVAALLGGVDAITRDRIYEINNANTIQALRAVATTADEFPIIDVKDNMTEAAAAQGAKLTEAYAVKAGGEQIGYAFKIVASGSQGDIEMIVGLDADNAVTGVSIVDNKETSGIGSRVMENEALPSGVGVLDQFIGMSGAGSLSVGGNVEAITGATVSSKGVTKGVNAALAVAEALG